MKALHSFETTEYVKLPATQHNTTKRPESSLLQDAVIPVFLLGREVSKSI
jgi:hypothetical protein